MSLKTKLSIGFLIGIYFFSHSFTQWIFGFGTQVQAAEEIEESIIAVFVDKEIYGRHTNDINWYAQEYLQKRSSSTKTLVMPLDKNNFQAVDIRKMLENLYQEGIKEKKSSLIGTILIGELPLPVIKENNYIYPSIYPYTDLSRPTYVYDSNSTYFVPQENGDQKADIRQSIINFEQRDEEYNQFFSKLRAYDQNPSEYTSNKIRYDDFIGMKKYFSDQFLSGYINNFLFHEDITYHRFTNLILDYFKDGANSNAISLINNYTANVGMSTDDDYSQLGDVGKEYTDAINKWKGDLNTMAQEASVDLNTIGNDSNRVPTLMIGQALSSLVQPYTSLFAPEFLTNISTNAGAGGRWQDAQVDSHIKKTVLKDNITSAVLLDANTILEKATYNKLNNDKYSLHIPIPLLYEEYDCGGPIKTIDGRYENFYFGKSAYDISSTQDISIYPGTWKNIGSRQNLTTYNYSTQGEQDDIAVDYTARSIGASYGISSRQVESSRGYNTMLVPADQKFYEQRKCDSKQTIDDFVKKYWGGISPLNVDGNTMQLKENNPKMAWNPRFDTSIGGPVFDIAGSKMTLTKMNNNIFFLEELNNSMLHRTQQFRLFPWVICGDTVPAGTVNENWYNGYPQKQPNEVEYFSRFASQPDDVYLTNNNTNTSKHECGDNYVYKTIDTLESHTSPTADQIKGMSPLTQDRPIDSARFVAFKGIGGGAIKFDYPNIYNVEVYKKTGNDLTLKNADEIAESIKTYLKQKVVGLNAKLTQENTNAATYYASRAKAFDNLQTIDSSATPKGRTYAMLPENFFIDALGENTIKSVAEILYRQNLGWYNKPASSDLMTDLKNNQGSLDINKKIGYVTENYLNKIDNPSASLVPGYEPKGYELVYINSDGNDILKNTSVPAIIDSINQRKLITTQSNSSSDAVNAGLEMIETQRNEKCGIEKNASVPLLKWPQALACWMQGLKDMALSEVVKINFNNAQGPVFSLDQFKDTATTWGENVERFSDKRKTLLGKDGNQSSDLVRSLDATLGIRLNKASISMDDRNDISLSLSSKEDLGNLSVRISGTGDNCPIVDGRNICRSEYSFQGNLFSSPRVIPVTLAGTNVGSSIMNVKVCQNTRCTERQISVPIIAGTMTNISVVTPTDKVLYNSQVPFVVMGYDAYGNPVEQTTITYRLSSSIGSIINNGSTTSGMDIQTFGSLQNYFLDLTNVPSGTSEASITLEPVNAATGTVAPRFSKKLSLTQGTLNVKYNTQTTSQISLTLPESTDGYFQTQNGVAQLQESALPRIVLTLTSPDGKPIDSTAVVRSTQGLLIPGTSKETTYSVEGKNATSKEFSEQSSFTIKGGVATVLLYPSFKAGNDTLTIEVPGLPLQTISVNVNSAAPYRVAVLSPDSILPEQSATGRVLVYDRWDNPVTKATNITLQTIGDIQINGSNTLALTTDTNGFAPFSFNTNKLGGTNYIYATIQGVDQSQQLPDAKTITTLAPLWKTPNLNAMYMLLGGNDRGNRWSYFTDQTNEADKVLTSSDKTLAVTTLLTHPDRILAAAMRVSQNGQVYDGQGVSINVKDNALIYDLGNRGYISLGNTNTFNLRQGAENEPVGNNTLVYTPLQTDSSITENKAANNTIIVNGATVWGFNSANNAAEIVMSSNYDNNRDLIRDVMLQGRRVGTLRLHASLQTDNFRLHDSAGVEEVWLGGSTNTAKGWMIYDRSSSPLSSQTSWAGGMEDSRDPDTNTSRKNTFQAASAFAEGDSAGSASQHGATPFLISMGDPLISRQNGNTIVDGTEYDAGIGKTIFTETDKSIAKTTPFDLDRNGQKDLLVIYTDGSIRVLQNKGGKDPYTDLGMLMVIADGIKDVFVGDTDGNSFEDIMIQTNDDKLRVYKNNEGSIEVDGRQVCLDIPGGNENVKNAHEMFIEDMDKDGNIDIVTNDTLGNINVFYGGSSSAGDNYISKNINDCDDKWQSRIEKGKKLVKSYGVSLVDGQKTYDNSLIHWKGLTLLSEPDPANDDEESTLASQSQFQNLIKGKDSDFTTLDVGNIINSGLPEVIQYSASPISRLPSYETNISTENIAYMPIHLLDNNSPVTVYKEYSRKASGALTNGEKINVKVTIQSKQATQFTFLDEIRGPWELQQNDDGSISSRDKGTLPQGAVTDWTISNGYAYMIDNISLAANQSVSFSYELTYISPRLVSIQLDDINTDSYTDIKTYSTDSCQKGYWTFTSDKGKEFPENYINLDTEVAQVQKQAEDDVKSLLAEVQGKINNAAESEDPKILDMPGMDQVLESWDQSKTFIQNGNLSIDINNASFDKFVDEAELQVDTAIKGLCEGFKLGQGGATSGPPVPFNMAFLSPGTYNIFGCKLMNDKGLPAFFFPGTVYAGPLAVPFPYGQKGSTDGFYRAPGGVYPSMIRIYVSPTITMGVGIAICFGPYSVGSNIPNPFRHIAGNCVVVAKNLLKNKNNNNTPTPTQLTVPSWQYNLAQGGNCNRPTNDPNKPGSPFALTPAGTNYSSPASSAIPGGGYAGGLIYFDQEPQSISASRSSVGSVKLKGGKPLKLEIQGGNVKGLVKCIIQKWLDNQMRYIINNMTNLQVNLYLPDVSTLFEGFDNLSLDKLGQLYNEVQTQTNVGPSSRQDVVKSLFTKEGMRQNSDTVSNPFDALSTLFENIPLININTKNVNVQIPFIAQEDITKYKSYLNDWAQRNEKVIQEWNMAAQDLEGKCNSYSSAFERNACKQKVESYIDVSDKSAQVVRALKQNINTLEQYRKFPIELNKWLGVSQRYLTEVSDTVTTFTYSITNWLQLNARRFEQYVDAIIVLISAVKTWQVIIDFSVNRKTKCGKCKVDNYDFYSCTLSLLCINLPILPIPNFRIPNINIDLSHIDLVMDVLLPKFNFVPVNVPLPRLPDLPIPPTVDFEADLNVSIPQIPVIPAPPTLPELPSFIPNVELNLPTLPPSPRIPKIAPQIQQTLKVAEFIAKVFCIVKGGIGLVGEKGVKTRIEQLTQRTWAVEPFDSISVTKIQPPLKGFDIEIDTYVNMQFNFNAVYDLLDQFAQQINNNTNEVFTSVVTENIGSVSSASNDVSNTLQNTVDQGNINGSFNPNGYYKPQRWDLQYEDTNAGKIDMLKQVHALLQVETSVDRKAKLNNIVAFMNTPAETAINVDGLEAVRTQATDIIDSKKKEISDIQNKIINEYDSFVQSLQTTLVSDETENATLGAALFTANKSIIDTVKAEPNPTQSYLELNKTVMEGFSNAFKKHPAEELNMSLLTYNETKHYVNTTRNAVEAGLDALAMNESEPVLLGANAGGTPHNHATSSVESSQSDISQYVKGIFVKNNNGDMVNVVNRDDIIDTLEENNTQVDLNGDAKKDLLLWDQKQIWIKYADPNKAQNTTIFTRLYRTPTFNTPNDVANEVKRGGVLNVAGSTFKLWDTKLAPEGFALGGQSYDTITVQWKNNNAEGYIVQMTEKVTNRHNHLIDRNNTKYILVLSSGTNLDGLFLYSELFGGQKRVSDLVNNGNIMYISYFDPADESIGLTIPELPRAWQYISVAKLGRREINRNGIMLEKNSPWTQQEVAGIQSAGDNMGPTATVSLIRTQNNTLESQGYSLQPIAGNTYNLVIDWSDESGVKDNSIVFANGNTQQSAGNRNTISNMTYKTDRETMTISAQDNQGNTANYTINLQWKKPAITITDVENQNNTSSTIDTAISEGVDAGKVIFERERNGIWTLLTGIDTQKKMLSLFPLGFNQKALQGGLFVKNDLLSLYDSTGKRVGTIDKNSGEISLDAAFKDTIDIQIVFSSNIPNVLIKEKSTGKVLFSVVLKGKTALNTTITDSANRGQKKLNDGYGQTFTNGTCITDKQNQCRIYIGTQGAIWIPDTYKNDFTGTYTYNDGAITIKFFDRNSNEIGTTRFIPQPLP